MSTVSSTITGPVTGEMLARMGGLGPCELVHGEIRPTSPTNWRHADYVSILTTVLRQFADERQVGRVLTGEVGLFTRRDPDTVRGADVAFVSHERLARVTSDSFLDVAPELVVEVVSPSNTWEEMRQKLEEYFGIGVDVVWIVEPARRHVLVYRAATDLTALREEDVLRGEGRLEGFTLALSELFA